MSDDNLPEMVERVRDAISAAFDQDHNLSPKAIADLARAAIEAMREPTDEMIDACDINIPTTGMIVGVWDDMIGAALDE